MYSKFGRQCIHQFAILTKKDQILSGKTRKFHSIKPNFSHKSYLSDQQIKRLVSQASQPQNLTPPKPSQQSSSSFLSQSRQAYYKSTSSSHPTPPAGHYECNYLLLKKKSPQIDLKLRPKSASRVKTPIKNPQAISPSIPFRHIQSPIPFDKQIPRNKPTKNQIQNSVSLVDTSELFFKIKRSSTPDLSKQRPRCQEPNRSSFSPGQYKPSYKLINKDLGKVPKFQKYSVRKSCVQESYQDYFLNYKQREKRVATPIFSKGVQRFVSKSPFPEYMKSAGSRISLNVLNQKMLVLNQSVSPGSSVVDSPFLSRPETMVSLIS